MSPAIRSVANQLVTSVALGHSVEDRPEVAGVVGCRRGTGRSTARRRVDEAEDLLDPLLAEQGRPRVDDHRLGAQDHHRVDVHGDGGAGPADG